MMKRPTHPAHPAHTAPPTPHLHTIDLHWLGHAQAIGCYALRAQADSPVTLIDPGPHSTIDALVHGLATHGISPSDVRDVIVTHIHLDHAGAAWWWAQHGGTRDQPVRIHVHHFGARHLIDPSRLLDSAQRIYAAQMHTLWGELHPIDAAHVHAVHDEDSLNVAGLVLHAMETPGHARHHHAYRMELGHETICFTGDAAAMTVPGRDFVSLPTPPPEFDLPQWLTSIERLEQCNFDALYPTHFGRVEHPARWLRMVRAALNDHCTFVKTKLAEGITRPQLDALYHAWLTDHAQHAELNDEERTRHITDSLIGMNLTGMLRSFT